MVVVDGIGHGDEAADAAIRVIAYLEGHHKDPLIPLVKACHENLKDTRGVVMSIALVNARYNTIQWLGVGNVGAVLLRGNPGIVSQQEHIIMRGGVLGHSLPTLQTSFHPLTQGDIIIFTTDGVAEAFTRDVMKTKRPEHCRYIADAMRREMMMLVLVAVISAPLYEPPSRRNFGKHHVALSSFPHHGGEDALQAAYELGRSASPDSSAALISS
jgi:hypothetical protein